MEEITRDNYRKININDLALNSKFGALTFDNAAKKLEKIKNWFSEFEDLDYRNEFPQNIVNDIDNRIQEFVGHLNWLRNFDITTSPNAKQEHDDFENRIDSFYNEIFSSLVANRLIFLRQEVESKSKDKNSLRREQKEFQQTRKESKEIVSQLKDELERLRKEKNQIEATKGEIAAVRFGKHFESQSREYSNDAKAWLIKRNKFFSWLMVIVGGNFIVYLFLFITDKVNFWPNFLPKDFFTLEYGLVNLALLSLLSYGVSFMSKNYNVTSNLEAVNKHRKNVAETVNDFLGSGGREEDRAKIIEQGTNSMFKHLPIGYLPKIEAKDDGPIASILGTILRKV